MYIAYSVYRFYLYNDVSHQPEVWPAAKKMIFRFFFVFFLLTIIFEPNGALPGFEKVYYPLIIFSKEAIGWLAKHMLHIVLKPAGKSYFENNMGQFFDYWLYLFMVFLSALLTLIWSLTDLKTENYKNLHYWLIGVLRCLVAMKMMFFGFSGVFIDKPPSLGVGAVTMENVIYRADPSHVIWFIHLAGIAGLMTAIFLFSRRSTRFGATLGMILMLCTGAVSFCYRIPLRLTTISLFSMCLFLLAPDYKKFIRFFLRNKDVLSSEFRSFRFDKNWKNATLSVIRYGIILYTLYWNFDSYVP